MRVGLVFAVFGIIHFIIDWFSLSIAVRMHRIISKGSKSAVGGFV